MHYSCIGVCQIRPEFGQIWEKWPNFGLAEAEAEIRCNPRLNGFLVSFGCHGCLVLGLTYHFFATVALQNDVKMTYNTTSARALNTKFIDGDDAMML